MQSEGSKSAMDCDQEAGKIQLEAPDTMELAMETPNKINQAASDGQRISATTPDSSKTRGNSPDAIEKEMDAPDSHKANMDSSINSKLGVVAGNGIGSGAEELSMQVGEVRSFTRMPLAKRRRYKERLRRLNIQTRSHAHREDVPPAPPQPPSDTFYVTEPAMEISVKNLVAGEEAQDEALKTSSSTDRNLAIVPEDIRPDNISDLASIAVVEATEETHGSSATKPFASGGSGRSLFHLNEFYTEAGHEGPDNRDREAGLLPVFRKGVSSTFQQMSRNSEIVGAGPFSKDQTCKSLDVSAKETRTSTGRGLAPKLCQPEGNADSNDSIPCTSDARPNNVPEVFTQPISDHASEEIPPSLRETFKAIPGGPSTLLLNHIGSKNAQEENNTVQFENVQNKAEKKRNCRVPSTEELDNTKDDDGVLSAHSHVAQQKPTEKSSSGTVATGGACRSMNGEFTPKWVSEILSAHLAPPMAVSSADVFAGVIRECSRNLSGEPMMQFLPDVPPPTPGLHEPISPLHASDGTAVTHVKSYQSALHGPKQASNTHKPDDISITMRSTRSDSEKEIAQPCIPVQLSEVAEAPSFESPMGDERSSDKCFLQGEKDKAQDGLSDGGMNVVSACNNTDLAELDPSNTMFEVSDITDESVRKWMEEFSEQLKCPTI